MVIFKRVLLLLLRGKSKSSNNSKSSNQLTICRGRVGRPSSAAIRQLRMLCISSRWCQLMARKLRIKKALTHILLDIAYN